MSPTDDEWPSVHLSFDSHSRARFGWRLVEETGFKTRRPLEDCGCGDQRGDQIVAVGLERMSPFAGQFIAQLHANQRIRW
jgi:hypothetical protein